MKNHSCFLVSLLDPHTHWLTGGDSSMIWKQENDSSQRLHSKILENAVILWDTFTTREKTDSIKTAVHLKENLSQSSIL